MAYDLAHHVSSLPKFHQELHSTDTTRNQDKPIKAEGIMAAKAATLIMSEQVGVRLSHFWMLCVLNPNCLDGYADMASTTAAYTKIVFSAIVDGDNRRCTILQILSCIQASNNSMYRQSTTPLRRANRHAQGESTDTSKTDPVDPIVRTIWMLPAQRP